MRLIDADELLSKLNPSYKDTVELIQAGESHLDSLSEGYTEVHDLIISSPTVNAVEVVRCKDCKRHEDEEPGMVYCPLQIGGWRSENWFCAAGGRKDNG